MLYVVNDLHGHRPFIDQTVAAIQKMNEGDILIVNGDGAGARGPRMNKLVKIFYEVRRGESDYGALLDALEEIIGEKPDFPKSWVYDAVHAGVFRKVMADRYEAFNQCLEEELLEVLEETLRPLSEATAKKNVQLLYVPGNGEVVPGDFSTEDITVEKALPPEQRFYSRLAREGYFSKFGVIYVGEVLYSGDEGLLVVSTNMLDMSVEEAYEKLRTIIDRGIPVRTVIVHYPPAISPLGGVFGFWKPNAVDVKRTDALNGILERLNLVDGAMVYFGHIHLGPNDPKMEPLPISMTFRAPKYDYTWVKPGTVVRIR